MSTCLILSVAQENAPQPPSCVDELHRIQTLEATINSLQSELEQSKRFGIESEQKFNNLQSELEQSKQYVVDGGQRLNVLQSELEQSKRSGIESAQQLSSLQLELEQSKQSSRQGDKKLKDMQKDFEDAKRVGTERESMLANLRNELEKKQLTEESLQKQLETVKEEGLEGKRISLTKFGSQCASLSNDVMQHVLKSTDLDEKIVHHSSKIVDHISNTAAAARSGAISLKNKISSVNYTDHYVRLQSSTAVRSLIQKSEFVQPHVDKAIEKARPILDKVKNACQPVIEKAEPFLTKAKDICRPVLEKASTKCATVLETVQEAVVPAMQAGSSQVFNSATGAGSTLDRIVAPVFEKAGVVAPQHLDTLPQHPVDRVLFLLAFVVFTYYTMYLSLFSLRVALKFLGKTTLMSFFIFRIVVIAPLLLLKKIVSFLFWFATGFYCCGLCSSRKSQSTPVKSQKQGQKEKAKATFITPAELEKVLNSQKKGDMKDKAVTLLASHAKSGKPLDKKFKQFEGNMISKDVLSQTCKKLGIKASI